MPKKKRGYEIGIQQRVKLQLAFQDRRVSMRLSGMKLPMLLTPLVLLNPLGLPLLNLTKQVPGEEVIKPVFKSGLAQQRRRYFKVLISKRKRNEVTRLKGEERRS